MPDVKNRELLSQAEYARRRGVTEAAVSKAIRRCGIPLVDGKLDPLVADTLWKARTDPNQQRRALGQQAGKNAAELPPPPPKGMQGQPDAWTFRNRREAAEARLAELELQEREGALVKVAEVQAAARRLAAGIVQQLESMPDRIAAEFGADDAMRSKIRQRLREEFDRIRDEFARAGGVAVQ